MKKQDYIDNILAIDPAFTGDFTVAQLKQHLAKIQADSAPATADLEALIDTVDTATTTAAKFETNRNNVMSGIDAGRAEKGKVQANIWPLMVADLGIVKGKDSDNKDIWIVDGTKLDVRPKCLKTGEATEEMHEFYQAPQLTLLREAIEGRGVKGDDRFIADYPVRNTLASFNTGMRELCKSRGIEKIQMQGNAKGGYYFRSYPDQNHVAFKDMDEQEKAKAKHDELEKALDASNNLTSNVPFDACIHNVIAAYITSGDVTPAKAVLTLEAELFALKELAAAAAAEEFTNSDECAAA